MLFKTMIERQKEFSDLFFDSTKFDDAKREEMTKSFALALHAEVADLVSSINFKDHHANKKTPDREKILYESIDTMRYLFAIMNTWGFSADEVESAYSDKDTYLHTRHRVENEKWDGRPVLIVDIDDVIAHFRKNYFEWLDEKYGIVIPQDYPEYYASTPLKEKGVNPESSFKDFISDRKLRTIEVIDGMIEVFREARRMGFWVQLLTARPDQNLICLYDTYHWLERAGVPFDGLAFSGEKYRWIVMSQFYGKVAACVDDSPKHSAEYANHGLLVLSPTLSYNDALKDVKNVVRYDSTTQLLTHLTNLYKDFKK
jgi:dimeric dUTPase (all-alpha-NTP-PPase superfamily)